jgi:hypothetical protein
MWLVWILTTKHKSMKKVENFENKLCLLLLLVDFVNQAVCFAVLTCHFRFNLQTVLLSG